MAPQGELLGQTWGRRCPCTHSAAAGIGITEGKGEKGKRGGNVFSSKKA